MHSLKCVNLINEVHFDDYFDSLMIKKEMTSGRGSHDREARNLLSLPLHLFL